MALAQRIRHPWSYRAPARPVRGRTAVEPADGTYAAVVVSRLIWLAGGIISLLLALRFIFAAVAANPANGFVDFIYRVSHPFAAPFFNMFNYNDVYIRGSGSHIEIYSLVAIVIYLAAAWILSVLFSVGRRY